MQGSAGVVGAAAGLAAASRGAEATALESVVIGLIGCGQRGVALAKDFAKIDGVAITHVCDPDDERASSAAKTVASSSGKAPKVVRDLRQVLDDKSVDAVVIATPDHWHAPASILACDAGKHVYVEKPCSHNLREGRLMVEAARRQKKVMQVGTQSRSSALVSHAIQRLREGVIGDVMVAKAFDIQRRKNIGHELSSTPPPGFDYDLWLGPAPYVPFQSNRHHYTWHWWYDFGTGDMGNDGVHELDIARWGLGVSEHPSTIVALGGKYVFDDDQQFPDTQLVAFEYPGDGKVGHRRQLVFEMRIWSPYSPEDGIDNGNLFYGTDGWMLLSKRGTVKVFDAKNRPRPLGGEPSKMPGHQEDFLTAIRTGKTPNGDITVGHVSTSLCHLGNIATRLGRALRFDPAAERFMNDPEAERLLSRTYRDGHWAVPKGV
jgi:predicted dehydrogenase